MVVTGRGNKISKLQFILSIKGILKREYRIIEPYK
jgi:hypothetical protein